MKIPQPGLKGTEIIQIATQPPTGPPLQKEPRKVMDKEGWSREWSQETTEIRGLGSHSQEAESRTEQEVLPIMG